MFAASKTASVSGGYQISRSLRFNAPDSAYLNRTPASATNRKTWTWSGWLKKSNLGAFTYFFGASPDSFNNTFLLLSFGSSDNLRIQDYQTGFTCNVQTTAVYRDVSAWYHVVIAIDTTQATAANRVRLYVNGVEVTAFSTATYPTQNTDLTVDNNVAHVLGYTSSANDYNGYMTEVNFIDGQQLTPSSFGQTDAQTGVWTPIAYSGSYGTNGFYLNFSDNSNTTAATLGKDYSGNGNNWTPNNFSVTAGAGNDSLVDSPTSYGTDTGVGGTVRGNYCTWNPLKNPQVAVLTNGNLDLSTAGSTARYGTYTTLGVTTGQWYWEITAGSLSTDGYNIGIVNASKPDTTALNADTNSYIYLDTGLKGYNGTGTAYGATYTAGDVIGVALDLDAGTLVFYKNGTSQGTAFTGIASNTWFPTVADNATGSTTGSSFIANFGQRPFAYTAPSGYKALCTQNLPTPTIGATTATTANKYFNPVLYTGNGGTQSVTGVGFQPDFTWVKSRTTLNGNGFEDAVRGAGQTLESNNTSAEVGYSAYFTAFTSDGFNMALGGGFFNSNGQNYVAWNWKANGSGSTNTAGSITSTVSANTTSGFSVVTWTASGGNATVGHGLGVAPAMLIYKSRNAAGSWVVLQQSLTNMTTSWLKLNTADSELTGPFSLGGAPTSSVFYSDSNFGTGTMVTYCFAEIAGYSKISSFTGNGSADGPFVYCGFRPAFVMVKNASVGYDWWIFDNKRLGYNVTSARLAPDLSDAEYTSGSIVDFTANGFKIRDASNGWNGSGNKIIFAAFAEVPTKFSLAR